MSFIIKIPSNILILFLLAQYVSSQNISSDASEIELFNQSMAKYNNTKMHFDDITNKMKNISFNILLKIRYKEVERCYKTVINKFMEIQNELKEANYERENVKKNIKLLDSDINTFEKKYRATKSLYFEFERTKNYLIHFLKIFFICLFVSVLIIMAIVGIVSYFVVKNQRRYYKLQEEYSFNTDQKELNKNSTNANDINSKPQDEQTDSRNSKIKIVSSNNPSSQDEMKKE